MKAPGLHSNPGGIPDNSPPFQRWVRRFIGLQVPKGRLRCGGRFSRPFGTYTTYTVWLRSPNVETLGYYRMSLLDNECEKNIRVNNDAVGIHSASYSPKRCLFFSHQSALISSDSCQAAFSVSLLRRAILSTRNQLTKSFTWSTDMPSVGKVRRTTFLSALTSIILKKYREGRRLVSSEL